MIAVCGCMAQQKQIVEKFKASYPFVDIVFGVNAIDNLPQLIAQRITGHKRVMQMPVERTEIVEEMPIQRGSSFRAWLPIMYGCDNFCTYCIVPMCAGGSEAAKAPIFWRSFAAFWQRATATLHCWVKMSTATGKGLDEGLDFADLLALLDKEPGDYRIRFMTSHPKDATKKLIDTIAAGTHLSHHLHLPVQSGSNEILDKMNRRYTVESYLDLMDYAKERVPDMTYSSDIIVGFPGETEEDFEKTMELIRPRGIYAAVYFYLFQAQRDESGRNARRYPARGKSGTHWQDCCLAG